MADLCSNLLFSSKNRLDYRTKVGRVLRKDENALREHKDNGKETEKALYYARLLVESRYKLQL